MKSRFLGSAKVVALVGLLAAAGGFALSGCNNGTTPRAMDPRGEGSTHGTIQHVSEADFEQQVLGSSVPVLVDFYAQWCGPCQRLAPALEELAAETVNAKIVKVDIDQNPALADRYGIRTIPNLLVFKDGQVAAQEVGFVDKERLKAMLGRR